MKHKKSTRIIIILVLLLSLNGCSVKEESRVITEEQGGSITVIDNGDKETQEPVISVEKIVRLENVCIDDWLDEETVIVNKENAKLGKMTQSDSPEYPNSLYYYSTKTKKYKLIKEEKNVNLGGATLSVDKKHLLYVESTLGDPGFSVMNLDTKDTFSIVGKDISCAKSAGWIGNEVAGAAYENGAYLASASGDISVLEGLEDVDSLFIFRATKDNVYFNSGYDFSLIKMNRTTKEKTNLNLKNVYDVILSYDETKMLVLQNDSTKSTLLLCDLDGSNQVKIAEDTGMGISSISWSADQRLIAYNAGNGIYVYDMLTAKANQIVVDVQSGSTCWSPLGDKLAYTQMNGEEYDSSIVYLKSSIQK